ncbi:hypothetical protein ACQPZ8_28720 [Actinomadura nitritigenes]|uniref:hypothetical protein n=1 Tax=Actinomadura nitritigenes TaxID=134602 RepID=UPI003D8FA33C
MTTGLLRSGPLTAEFHDGELHDVRVCGIVVADRVHFTLRDADWGTATARLSTPRIATTADGFSIGYEGRADALPFSFLIRIDADGGTVRFAAEGHAEAPLRANRIGICVLHPQSLAGTPVEAVSGSRRRATAFPVEICPHQPFTGLSGLEHSAGPGRVTWTFEGETFETEDQRNWTDPSYKTYAPPLDLPFPRTLATGDLVRQSVTLRAIGPCVHGAPGPAAPSEIHLGRPTPGNLPAIGLTLPLRPVPLDERAGQMLRSLHPSHLRTVLDTAGDWRRVLAAAAHDASAVGAPLDVELVSRASGRDLFPVIDALGAMPIARLHAYDAESSVTTPEVAEQALAAMAAVDQRAPFGGGSRANYAELNRAVLPLNALDFLTYGISPQVHAFDDTSVMGTLSTQPATLRGARTTARGRPVLPGPLTLLPRFNPVATTGIIPSLDERPPPPDPRQPLPFTAAWAIGALAALRGADNVTLFETTGPGGVFEHPEHPFPIYDLLAVLARHRGARLLDTAATDPLITALGLATAAGPLVLVANLAAAARRIHPPFDEAVVRHLTADSPTTSDQFELPGHSAAVIAHGEL